MKSFVTNRTVSAGPIGVSVPPAPSGAFHIPSMTGVVPLAVELHLQAGDLREPPGAPVNAGSQTGEKPFTNAVRQLAPGERQDHRAVAERQDGEHLAPRDLARLPRPRSAA